MIRDIWKIIFSFCSGTGTCTSEWRMFKDKELSQQEAPKEQQGVDNDNFVNSVLQCKDACTNLDSCVAFTYYRGWDNPCFLQYDQNNQKYQKADLQKASDRDFYLLIRNCGEYISGGSERIKSRSNRKY